MAISFLKAIPEIKKKAKTKTLLFCLDFDGTLTPIRRNPAAVKPSSQLLRFLRKAAQLSFCKVVIISGRSLKDLKRKLPIPGIILVGSHGLEWSIKNKKDLNRSRKLRKIQKKWQSYLRGAGGVHFESKPFSFVLHYRRCHKAQQKKITEFFLSEQHALLEQGFEWTSAHKAFEVFESVRGRKEHASQEFLNKFHNSQLIVAGDDVTDFEMLALGEEKGWAVTVGFSRAGVKYFVKGPGELVNILHQIIAE